MIFIQFEKNAKCASFDEYFEAEMKNEKYNPTKANEIVEIFVNVTTLFFSIILSFPLVVMLALKRI